MSVVALDCETTISNIGHPFDSRNKLVAVGLYSPTGPEVHKIEYEDNPYGQVLSTLGTSLSSVSLCVLFNAKFDLTWLWKYGIDLSSRRVWDCQLFEYMASNQTWILPDLDTSASRRSLPITKEREIEEYWKAGIDTTEIPWELIEKRVRVDAELTYRLYEAQLEEFNTWPQAKKNLFRLHCADLMVLHEIERNGFYYAEEESEAEACKTSARILELEGQIKAFAPGVDINLNSPQQVSALLYGGDVWKKVTTQVGFYKTGQKAGQPKFVTELVAVTLPRLIEPVEGTKLEDGEHWSSDQKVLGRLLNSRIPSPARRLITLLLDYSRQQRSLSSYTQGLPKLIRAMHWPTNMLYGKINQCSVVTGRTSSSQPNLQNFDSNLKHLFRSRYAT